MNVVALQHTRLPQNLLPVFELLEGDDHRPENIVWTRADGEQLPAPAAHHVGPRHHAGGAAHREVPLDVQARPQHVMHLTDTDIYIQTHSSMEGR